MPAQAAKVTSEVAPAPKTGPDPAAPAPEDRRNLGATLRPDGSFQTARQETQTAPTSKAVAGRSDLRDPLPQDGARAVGAAQAVAEPCVPVAPVSPVSAAGASVAAKSGAEARKPTMNDLLARVGLDPEAVYDKLARVTSDNEQLSQARAKVAKYESRKTSISVRFVIVSAHMTGTLQV